MKHFLLIILFSFTFLNIFSQNSKHFYGAIKLNDSTLIPYKLYIEEVNGSINGYSITDLGGDHQTKSLIKGSYNKNAKLLVIKEHGVVYTKSTVQLNDFCYIHSSFKNFSFKNNRKIKATFKGLFSDNTQCIDGELLLNAEEKVIKKAERANKIIAKSKKINDSIKENLDLKTLISNSDKNVLKKNNTLNVFIKNTEVDLVLYDAGQEDNDIITLYINNKPVLRNYIIKNEKKIIPILIKDKILIKIKAENNGNIGGNTMKIEIKDGNKIIDAATNLKKGDFTSLRLLRQ